MMRKCPQKIHNLCSSRSIVVMTLAVIMGGADRDGQVEKSETQRLYLMIY